MEDIELKQMWAEYDKRLEQGKVLKPAAWALNLQAKDTANSLNQSKRLNRLAPLHM